MCGIAGHFSRSRQIDPNAIHRMTRILAHRGPDAEGFYIDDCVGLGHRRLSIIDLSEAANQPFHSATGNCIIIFNGEIYNYRELAQQHRLKLRTHSDTEVLVELFEKSGPEFVTQINGMFAFAIYDKRKKELYLFRDRIGIKPIYYYWDGQQFAFASELKSLMQLHFINDGKTLNKQAINHYLYLGYIPEPDSIFENVSKFPSGCYLKVSEHDFLLHHYWKPEACIKKQTINHFTEAKKQLNNLIHSSVRYRMISDVPFGTFLSGGIDSSLVTAVAQRNSPTPVNTFSIGFKESQFNEAHHAARVAKYLGTRHHELMASHSDAIRLFDELLDVFDEPFADSSAIPTMLVSKLAREHVKMTLAGDGGDETYMGYGAYNWAKRLHHPVWKIFRKPLKRLLSVSTQRHQRGALVMDYNQKSKIKSHIFSQEQYFFSEKDLDALLSTDFQTDIQLQEDYTALQRPLTPAEQQAFFDLKYYLKDDLLVKVDRASMRFSLETRVPLLDHRLVEFALNLHPDLKMRGKMQKYLLKELLYDYIPREYFNRPKWGFAIPLKLWLKKELRHLLEDNLSRKVIEHFGIVRYEYVAQLRSKYLNGTDYLYNKLWALIVLHQFLNRNY
jgi:asparagine synthase (glutamine-hydrolysing)